MDYTKEIDAIAKAGESVQLRVHKLLNKIAVDWQASGDIRPAVTGVNYLMQKFPAGMRQDAVGKWVEAHFGFVWNTETEHFVAGLLKAKNLDMKAIKNNRWWEFTPPKPYQPVQDFAKLIQNLIAKGEKDRKKLGDKSAVDPALLAALRKVQPANTIVA